MRDAQAELKVVAGNGRGPLRRYVPDDEAVLMTIRPSPLFILLRPLAALIVVGVLAVGGEALASRIGAPIAAAWAVRGGAAVVGAILLWQWLEWLSRMYVLTERRMIAVAGVLQQGAADVPLRNVQNILVQRRLIERLTGLGTVAVATAGTSGFELAWLMLDRPDEVLRRVRAAVESARGGGVVRASGSGILVVGLVGGVGAGKSEVARALGEQGFVVIDADKEAKAALDRPEVRAEIIKWWGSEVLGADGRVDRSKVAAIVFANEQERARLERLVHPLVKSNRAQLVARAAAEGRAGVAVDAPLLLEAGSDAECDAVVFVDAPREIRLARVKASRGWDEAELARRAKAQIPLLEKQRRADDVIVNDAGPDVLRARVRELLDRLHRKFSGRS